MISDDEYLERIVAGIQSVTMRGADVTWNEIINGRQFDVVVRFMLGTLRYLVLIEVKNRTRKTSTSDMDAFVSKARDQNANKAVFVTAAGFQSGAIAVAKRHAVDLFTVTFDDNEISLPQNAGYVTLRKTGGPLVPPEFHVGDLKLVTLIERASLRYEDGEEFEMPSEASQMTYYVRQTKLEDGRTLEDLVLAAPFLNKVALDQSLSEVLTLDPPQGIKPPDSFFFPPGIITAIHCHITGRNAREIHGNTAIEPTLFTMPVVYTNVLTGENERFSLDLLPIGVARVSVGQFYFSYHPLKYYYCDAIRRHSVRWYLVESFQTGDLLQAEMTQNIKYSHHYIPVTDAKIINRLQARLQQMKTASNSSVISPEWQVVSLS
jgi:hypothetical protein